MTRYGEGRKDAPVAGGPSASPGRPVGRRARGLGAAAALIVAGASLWGAFGPPRGGPGA